MNFLEPKELQRLLESARKRSARDWAILLLGYRHGLRAIELSTLKVSDIDLKANVIRVARAKGSLETVQPIDGAVGGQPWLNERKALRLWLAERESYGDASDFLFLSQKGGQLTTNALWRLFATVAEEAGITGRSLHSLKHTRCSTLLQGGATVAETQLAVGHRALSSTLRYLHATPEQAAIAARRAEANVF
jgi:site-specific recombinase XerD